MFTVTFNCYDTIAYTESHIFITNFFLVSFCKYGLLGPYKTGTRPPSCGTPRKLTTYNNITTFRITIGSNYKVKFYHIFGHLDTPPS